MEQVKGENRKSPNDKAIVALGILFDWDVEAKKMLQASLPKTTDGDLVAGCAAVYANQEHEIIETPDPEGFPNWRKLSLPPGHDTLKAGETIGELAHFQDKTICPGICQNPRLP